MLYLDIGPRVSSLTVTDVSKNSGERTTRITAEKRRCQGCVVATS